jgi:K+-transporting ATPase ATPase B chain
LKLGDEFICEAGDIIPSDGEIVEGMASIDESAITGESAPVIRESGGDRSSVTGGTIVLSDHIRVKVTTRPGESFLDKMIGLVEGASRQKTPNEIALTILLSTFSLVFIIVCISLVPMSWYSGTTIGIAAIISLFVCLIPTTIGGLLSAIGIAGMDRALRANVIKQSLEHVHNKVLLTATPLQNSLLELYGLVSILDERVFGDLESFKSQFITGDKEVTLPQLRARLSTVCKRTLRQQVQPFVSYTARRAIVQCLAF